jgi:hypothetical protein
MIDNIEPTAALVALLLIVAAWIALSIRDRRRERDRLARLLYLLHERARVWNICSHVWRSVTGDYVVCSRPNEHDGPHLNQWTGDLDR